ncbi:MAG: hypothetical protein HY881_08680 [Deltaproteobacteria bacterium]|nr:hypothetical protein [Deltaproteobacteria bacterium]
MDILTVGLGTRIGAGFAVVADEVRSLALRSADAARNTSQLIEGAVRKIMDGNKLVSETNDAFGKVSLSASQVSELVSEIASASKEQSQGIEQINVAVTEMDTVTQQNAANAEETASAAEEMNAQAEQMKAIIQELVAIMEGNRKNHHDGRWSPVSEIQPGKQIEVSSKIPSNRLPLQHSMDSFIPLYDHPDRTEA